MAKKKCCRKIEKKGYCCKSCPLFEVSKKKNKKDKRKARKKVRKK